MTDWGLAFNRKHNKKIAPHIYGKCGMTATLNLYKNSDYNTIFSEDDLTYPAGDVYIYEDGQDVLIYDCSGVIGATIEAPLKKKFNYDEIMFSLTDIEGAVGAEFYGIDFSGAIIGE